MILSEFLLPCWRWPRASGRQANTESRPPRSVLQAPSMRRRSAFVVESYGPNDAGDA
jgi:hypothetical protein